MVGAIAVASAFPSNVMLAVLVVVPLQLGHTKLLYVSPPFEECENVPDQAFAVGFDA